MVFEFLLPRLCSVRHLVAKMDKDHQVPSGWQRLGERLCQGASPCSKTLLLLVGRHWQNSLACCRFNSVQTGALTKVDTATGFQFINMPVPVDHLQRRSLTPIRPFATPDPEPNATPGFAPTDNSTPSKAQWSRWAVWRDQEAEERERALLSAAAAELQWKPPSSSRAIFFSPTVRTTRGSREPSPTHACDHDHDRPSSPLRDDQP
eukprot:133887-Rhodomonas_salina.4